MEHLEGTLLLNTKSSNTFLPCSVTKERTEVIIEGTYDTNLGRNGESAYWQELEFNCKPGNITHRPCLISPYHYRLDWLMWFAAFQVRIITYYLYITIG